MFQFAGEPYEHTEAHFLRWMDTHAFPENVKVQRLCSGGEAKLWDESLRPTAVDWNELHA